MGVRIGPVRTNPANSRKFPKGDLSAAIELIEMVGDGRNSGVFIPLDSHRRFRQRGMSSSDRCDYAERTGHMSEGTIKRVTAKGFGFIQTDNGSDVFFHMSSVEGISFNDLQEGQRVSYVEGNGPKGPRAENVRPI